MRAVKDSPATPLSEKGDGTGKEIEDPRWTRAVGDHLARPQGEDGRAWLFDAHNRGLTRLPLGRRGT
jgi:hypothetical protein